MSQGTLEFSLHNQKAAIRINKQVPGISNNLDPVEIDRNWRIFWWKVDSSWADVPIYSVIWLEISTIFEGRG